MGRAGSTNSPGSGSGNLDEERHKHHPHRLHLHHPGSHSQGSGSGSSCDGGGASGAAKPAIKPKRHVSQLALKGMAAQWKDKGLKALRLAPAQPGAAAAEDLREEAAAASDADRAETGRAPRVVAATHVPPNDVSINTSTGQANDSLSDMDDSEAQNTLGDDSLLQNLGGPTLGTEERATVAAALREQQHSSYLGSTAPPRLLYQKSAPAGIKMPRQYGSTFKINLFQC